MMWNMIKRMIPGSLKRAVKRAVRNSFDSVRYWWFKGNFDGGNRKHVVFVCKGNICRSAFAEYYLLREMPEETLLVESCGIDVDQGFVSPLEAVRVAKEFELNLELHRSKGVAACNLQHADLILPMEFSQYLRLKEMFPGKQRNIRLLRDFAPWPDRLLCNIEDPYGLDENEFRRCFILLQRSLDGLKSHLALQGSY